MIEKKVHYHKYKNVASTLIQFADCDTEFFKQIAYESNIKRVTVTTCIDNQCQTKACKQDT